MNGIRSRWFCVALCVGLATSGCSDDGNTTTDGPTRDGPLVDTGPDSGAGVSQTFIVAEKTAAETPLQGATVAFDPPGGGTRVEKKTGADGKVTFDGINWAAGDATVTAHLDGYTLETHVDINPTWIAALPAVRIDGEALKILLRPLSPKTPESVTVSGTVKGLTDPTNRYVINVLRTEVGSEWSGLGNETFKVTVPKGADFVLQGLESTGGQPLPSGQGYQMTIKRVMHKAFTAVTQDVTGVELDFAANEVSTKTADATVSLPTRSDSPLRAGSPVCLVTNEQSKYTHGWASKAEVQPAQDQLAVSFIWTEPTWAKEVSTYCSVRNSATGDASVMYENNCPKAGPIAEPMLDVPKWITPASPATAHPLFSKMEWELFDKNSGVWMAVYKGQQQVWLVLMGPDVTSVELPQLPSSVDKNVLFGSGNLQVVVGGERWVADESYYRYSTSQGRLIKP